MSSAWCISGEGGLHYRLANIVLPDKFFISKTCNFITPRPKLAQVSKLKDLGSTLRNNHKLDDEIKIRTFITTKALGIPLHQKCPFPTPLSL